MPLPVIQIPPGIKRGAAPDDYPGTWYDGNMVRWREKVLEPVKGWARITASALAYVTRAIHPWRANDGTSNIVVGTDQDLRSYDGGAWTDITPAGLVPMSDSAALGGYGSGAFGAEAYGTGRALSTSLPKVKPLWSFSNFGEDVLGVLSTDGRLLYIDATTPSAVATVLGVYNIASITRAANVTTITTTAAHSLITGTAVDVAGVADTSFNATAATVTVVSPTSFTYANTGANGSSSGGSVRDRRVPINNRGVLVTPERHLMVFGLDGVANRFGWASRETLLDWDFASTTNTARYFDLDGNSPILTWSAVKEGTLILTESQAWLSRYIGFPYVYSKEPLGSAAVLSPKAIAEFQGRAVWMAPQGFYLYENGGVRPLPCDLEDYVFSDINTVWAPFRAHACANGAYNEIWFFYPSANSTECDRLVIWCWDEGWWSKGLIERTAMAPAGAYQFPIAAGANKHIYQHENDWPFEPYGHDVFAESAAIGGTEDVLNINQLQPATGVGTGRTSFTLYSRLTPEGAERSFGPYTMRSDGYVDCRVNGRDIRIRITGTEQGDWSVGKIRMKTAAAGGRR